MVPRSSLAALRKRETLPANPLKRSVLLVHFMFTLSKADALTRAVSIPVALDAGHDCTNQRTWPQALQMTQVHVGDATRGRRTWRPDREAGRGADRRSRSGKSRSAAACRGRSCLLVRLFRRCPWCPSSGRTPVSLTTVPPLTPLPTSRRAWQRWRRGPADSDAGFASPPRQRFTGAQALRNGPGHATTASSPRARPRECPSPGSLPGIVATIAERLQ